MDTFMHVYLYIILLFTTGPCIKEIISNALHSHCTKSCTYHIIVTRDVLHLPPPPPDS